MRCEKSAMEIQSLSSTYEVSILDDSDVPEVLGLCNGNPRYYRYCPPPVSEEGIRRDMRAIPEGKALKDKFYLGFWDGGVLIAVLDLICAFPDEKTAFIGFFMMRADMQGKGIGSKLVSEICAALKESFSYVRLGYVQGNEQPKHFWLKNGFVPTGTVTKTESYDIVVMQREL